MISVVTSYFSKRSQKIEVGSEFTRFLKRNKVAYEDLRGSVIPYYDFDNKYATKQEQVANYKKDFDLAFNSVVSIFPKDAKVYIFDACGQDTTAKEGGQWKNSFHVRVRGAGYYECGKFLPMADGCDMIPYSTIGKRQLLRIVGCSKKDNENRPLLRVLNGRTYQMDELKAIDETPSDYLVQNIENEILVKQDNTDDRLNKIITQLKNEKEKVLKMTKGSEIIEEVKLKTIVKLIDCLSPHRADDQTIWLKTIRCLKNIADDYKIDLTEASHKFSKQSDKYKSSEVDRFMNKDEPLFQDLKIGYSSLCYWAKTDDVDTYFSILAENRSEHQESVASILKSSSGQPREYQFSDFTQFIGKNLKKEDEKKVWKYLADSIIHVIDCGNHKIFTISKPPDGSTKFTLLNGSPFSFINDFQFTVDNLPKKMSDYFNKFYHTKSNAFMDFIPYLKSDPSQENVFNLFQGFPNSYEDIMNEELDLTKISNIMFHLEHIICDGDREMFEYVLNWTAHLFQKPAEKIGVALLLYTKKQGAGKNVWCDFLMNLLGSDLWYKTSRMDDLTSKFNYHLQSKLLVIGDEIANYAGYKVADQLKALITETQLAIEPKGKDPYCIKSSERYIFTTNSDVPLRIDTQDRRYITLNVSDSKVNDFAYFKTVGDEMKNITAQRIFLQYITTLDISKWDYRKLYINDYKKALMSESIDNIHEFLVDWLDEHEYHTQTRVNTFYDDYIDYCKKGNFKASNAKKFNRMLLEIGMKKKRIQNDCERRINYTFSHEEIYAKMKELGINTEKS